MLYSLETHQLTHRFSAQETVLDNISLQVPQGAIYGFLGPNGAGKTTTLRLVLGLLRKQQGSISILGQSFTAHRVALLRQVGSLIESPSVYSHLSAMENLQVLQKLYQCPAKRLPEVLELVGLTAATHKKAGRFSLGMKQRLGIAIALLNNPSLLILDEPTNGLDPNGIIEMRELVRNLNREQGLTVIISSHLLAEVEKLATHTGIIHKGRLLFQGTLDTLLQQRHNGAAVMIDTNDTLRTLELLKDQDLPAHTENGKVYLSGITKGQMGALNRQLLQRGITVYEICRQPNNLENIFMHLIND
ncbi:ABC transporter ATP-binding protein [Chitinophaga agrisoli]|uniref:ABC transporter ATP-binding protein n=1 Tax=Chitinophaga agrisoli TaxID=2607653 RepID=A0A5B2VVA6_9BACT|nr:ABC transporter ATP-binding protein [Chitinophaga agrisoli]KAA2242995.1 ABC transporter ATP-binding protein [Chitinophaga agrisoli]